MGDQISSFLQERIDAGDFPSAVYLVAEKGNVVLTDALGSAVVEPERIEARVDTIYDIASLTKPLVTGLLTAMLIESGAISLDQRVATVLDEFDVEGKRTITILDLLTHTSHLPAWRPFYLLVHEPAEIVSEIAKTGLDLSSEVIYSDLNFIILAAIVERFGGSRLDELASQRVFDPLGLRDTSFNPPAASLERIAASEKGNIYERQTCLEAGYIKSADSVGHERIRTDLIWGEVHDNNAHFMNGVAGHAGLFSTAEDVFRIALQFLPRHSTLFEPETCELFRKDLSSAGNEHRSAAFQLASMPDSTAGTKMSPQSFGHNGFTGTSVWIDPEFDRVYILLTNRTHHHALPFANINSVRRRFHDLATEFLNGDF